MRLLLLLLVLLLLVLLVLLLLLMLLAMQVLVKLRRITTSALRKAALRSESGIATGGRRRTRLTALKRCGGRSSWGLVLAEWLQGIVILALLNLALANTGVAQLLLLLRKAAARAQKVGNAGARSKAVALLLLLLRLCG